MRVETIGAATLYLGDCRDVLPMVGDVDHLLSDPPYSEHVHRSSMRRATGWHGGISIEERELGFEAVTLDQVQLLASYAGAQVRRWAATFSDTESSHLWRAAFEAAGLDYVRTAFWRKLNGAPQFTGDRPAVACEAITLCHPAGRKRWNGGGRQGFYDVPIVMDRGGPHHEARVHPTQKPLALMAALVRDFTDAGELIFDPFMGSGTTGVAALQQGRRFVGVEQSVEHFETACRRMAEAGRQPQLFDASPRPVQPSIFGGGE